MFPIPWQIGAVLCAFGAMCVETAGQLVIVDFEGLPEETAIGDQYADVGVTFSLAANPDDLPIIAVEGDPLVAFGGSGPDRPMSSRAAGLTDPVVGGDMGVGQDVRMDFDPPVTSVRFFVIDIDVNDVFTALAYDGETLVASVTRAAGDPGTGDGASTEFLLESESITAVVLDVPDAEPTGWALDFLTFNRPCEGAGCGPEIRIAQESAPGAGDFDEHVVGFARPFATDGTVAEFYAYDVPEGTSWNGPVLTPIADRSHLLFAGTAEGLSLFVVHDRAFPDDPDGGRAEMMFELLGDPDGAVRTLEDDTGSGDVYTGAPGDAMFTAKNVWNPCCTDGLVLSGLDCRSSMIVQFTDVDGDESNATIEGLLDWVAYSADGSQLPLALEDGRRVRLDILPDPECPEDLDCTGTVAFGDILLVLAAWGPCDGCPEDIDGSGIVDFGDVLPILAAWGPCAP